MFFHHSFTALLALPLFANAAVLPLISSILPLDEVTGLLGRQATTITPIINPVIPIGNSIVSSRQVTESSAVSAVLPALNPDEETDGAVSIRGRQVVTISPTIDPVVPIGSPSIVSNRQITDSSVVSAVLPALPHVEETDDAVIKGNQVVTVSPVISPVLPRGGSGTVQCCDSTQSASDLSTSTLTLFGLLGVVVSDLTANVGLTCSPISVIGVGGTSCSSQTVCCENNSFNGVIALGCSPINVGL
ncbi:fungal hydrophobin-domain-containing protein [Armillaria novae-zelandiae]|uniref:Hydrophobin n=1 Tax=Armillaria novae-zelandiae TaxID=153914 RepID=A0AA39NST8_9AGAR|nr:fungal hydrophobin-domain-containing protein [Armillaria novae-zelandiae]